MFQNFDWNLTHRVLFLYVFQSNHEDLRDQPWKMLIIWCRTDIWSCKFSAKVSFMLGNSFLVPSLFKLNHISHCFIQNSTKSSAKLLIPFMEKAQREQCFSEVIPSVLGPSVNFNTT